MTADRTIEDGGVSYPLETYIDAFRFVRVDPDAPPSMHLDQRVICIEGGAIGGVRLAQPQFGSDVRWHDVLAYRFLDHVPEVEPCFLCGTSADGDDICDGCEADAEYY